MSQLREAIPRVFIPQRPLRRDDGGSFVPKYDLTPAEKYGTIVPIVSSKTLPFNPEPVIAEMTAVLNDYTDEDYIIAIGNPALFSWAVAIAAYHNTGHVTMLQWDGMEGQYIPIEAQLWEE